MSAPVPQQGPSPDCPRLQGSASGNTRHRDVIVIGASAGGLLALQQLLPGLPADLPAAIFIATHMDTDSHLAQMLARASPLPVVQATQGLAIAPGRIYVAVPGLHLLLRDQQVRLSRGPHENMARPAIDALFRSAACIFGPRVIGVVLSGMLEDGAAGLQAIRRCGGRTVVQTPSDAAFAAMPHSALRRGAIDHMRPAAALGGLLGELVREPAGPMPPIPRDLRLDAAIAALAPEDLTDDGPPSRPCWPDGQGAAWDIRPGPSRRPSRTAGHAPAKEAMSHAQAARLQETLWVRVRAHQDRGILTRRMAEQEQAAGRIALADRLRQRALHCDEDAAIFRGLLRADSAAAPARGAT